MAANEARGKLKPSIYPLFSSPIMIAAENYAFSDDEQRFIKELEYAENTSNLMSKDTDVLSKHSLSGLREFVALQLHIYKKKLLCMQDQNEIYITQSWSNITQPGQFHPRHRHPNSLISGVIFVNGSTDHPPIRFHRSADIFPLELLYEDLNEFNATSSVFDPVPGRLILFPSLVEHDVEVNKTEQDRISLSFNTFVRGVVGGSEQLTEVSLTEHTVGPK